jgi:hypothetical protein
MRNSLIRFLLPLLVAGALLLGGWFWLRTYTKHGVAMRVPDLKGLSLEEAQSMLHARELSALVIDSVYSDELPKGSIVDQDPDAGIEVKPGRKIYVVLNASQPKMIDMPRLVDLSKRQAISVLEIIGLKGARTAVQARPVCGLCDRAAVQGQPIARRAHPPG